MEPFLNSAIMCQSVGKKQMVSSEVCICVFLNSVCLESQTLKLDEDVERPDEDPFTAKLSFEVRELL